MRRCAVLLAPALLLSLALPAAAQSPAPAPAPYVLTERIGPTIDPAERAYFGLFPGVHDFASARAEASEGEVRVVIERAAHADSVVTMAPSTATAVGRFIETFEQFEAAFYNPNWQIVSVYVRSDVTTPYTGRRNEIAVEVAGGRHVGHPFYVSDSLILLAPTDVSFDWRALDGRRDDFTLVRAEEVRGVRLEPGWLEHPWVPAAGAPIGFAVDYYLASLEPNEERSLSRSLAAMGAGVLVTRLAVVFLTRSRSYEGAMPDLRAHAWFSPEAYPAGLPAPGELAAERDDRSPAALPRWRSVAWAGLGVSAPLGGETEESYAFFTNFDAADSVRTTQVLAGQPAMTATALVRPLPWLSLGASLHASSLPDLGNTDLQEVAASRQTLRAFGTLDPVRLVWPRSRFGLGLGGGIVRGESVVAQRFPENNFTTYAPEGYELRETGFRPYLHATAEVVLPLDIALYGGVETWAAPDVEVPLTEVQANAFPGTVVYRVEPHTVSFERVGFVAGVRAGF